MERLYPVINWIRTHRRTVIKWVLIIGLLLVGLQIARAAFDFLRPRSRNFLIWGSGSDEERAQLVTTVEGLESCEGAPFILPAEGYIGLLYADPRGPYSTTHRHQGIDIFSNSDPGITPVYAAYDGYVTREEGWVSAVIMRVPDDPLQPGRQIWLYYTHMANEAGDEDFIEPAFEQGTYNLFVEQGTLLGYTGNYSGNSRDIWVHLHFSIVLDNGFGGYTNELDFNNTVDPSRYLGMSVNYGCGTEKIPACSPNPWCEDAILSLGGY